MPDESTFMRRLEILKLTGGDTVKADAVEAWMAREPVDYPAVLAAKDAELATVHQQLSVAESDLAAARAEIAAAKVVPALVPPATPATDAAGNPIPESFNGG